jgi:hypothetical protein
MSLSIFKLLKKYIYFFSFLISVLDLVYLIIFKKFKNKRVFLQPEGGFAHTILSPEVLKRLYDKNNWCIVFGYDPKRHNFLTSEIYNDHFYWLKLSSKFAKFSYIDEKYKKKIFLIFEYYLKKNKIEYVYYTDFINKHNNFNQSKLNPKYNKEGLLLHEYNAFEIFSKKDEFNAPNLISKKYKNIFFHLNKRKICGFGYKKKSNHAYTNERSTDTLENYKKSFFTMIENGWDIYIYGDQLEDLPLWFNEIENNIFYSNKSKLNKDEFNLRAGLISDCFIGPASGASSWKYIFHTKPQLIIDSYPIGWCFYNSVISFKVVFNHQEKKKINEIIDDQIYILKKPPFEIKYTSENEKNDIIKDFILNLSSLEKVTIKPSDLKLTPGHPLYWGKSTISKLWYEIQEKHL